jgi:ATP-dependent 26S proteasome regulatory subunit
MKDILAETRKMILAGVSAVHVCGDDYAQIDGFVEKLAFGLNFTGSGKEGEDERIPQVEEWNYGYGQVNFRTREETPSAGGGTTPLAEFLNYYKNTKYSRKKILLIKNARHILEGENNRENLARLQQTILQLKKRLPGQAVLVYADERRFVPEELASLIYFAELKPPAKEELAEIVRDFARKRSTPENPFEIPAEIEYRLSRMCVGMSEDSFKTVLAKAALEPETFNTEVIGIAQKTKKQYVDKSGLLTYIGRKEDENISDVGGLDYLKFWLRKKEKSIKNPDEALSNGITPPKGILLVGMPGCGKSLSAKATANLLDFPLLRLDIGSLMGKYVGESEENLRRALSIAERTSPCVLWLDELEKAFAGIEGDGTGITARLFGSFLTWLQEKTAPVFVVATANDIGMLRPELLRRGRFDEIFYVGFPNEHERKAIFDIHLKKLRIEKGSDIDTAKLAGMKAAADSEGADGYSGSDIESLINNAAETARNDGKPLSQEIILRSMKYVTPLKTILGEKLKEYEDAFKKYKIKSASISKDNMEMLESQVYGADPKERIKAAHHEFITEALLLKLAKDPEAEIKLAVLENPNIREYFNIILALRKDPDPTVREKAGGIFRDSTEGIIEIARNGAKEQKLKLPELPKVPDEALGILANEPDKDVRMALLKYKYLPVEIWKTLANDTDENVQKAVMEHPQCPKNIRKNLQKRCESCVHFIPHLVWCKFNGYSCTSEHCACRNFKRISNSYT